MIGVCSRGATLPSSQVDTTSKAIKVICQPIDYKKTCGKSLSAQGASITDPNDLIKVEFKPAIDELTGSN